MCSHKKENQFLTIAAKTFYTSEDVFFLKELVKNNIDWSYILYQCVHHRIVPIVYNVFVILHCWDKVEKGIQRIMRSECERIKQKNLFLLRELKEIYQILDGNDIMAILLKGLSVAVLYPEIAYREFTDIDFLIKTVDIKDITLLLNKNGYIQGKYNYDEGTIRPYTREEKLKHFMTTHECSEFVKKNDEWFCSSVLIDLNYQIMWNGGERGITDTSFFFKTAIRKNIDNCMIWGLSIECQFIQLCSHLYSEAFYWKYDPDWSRDKSDISLIKLCDIRLLILNENISWSIVKNIANELNINNSIIYSISCIEKIWEGTLPSSVYQYFVIDFEIINLYSYNKNVYSWNRTLEERLFNIQEKSNI